MRTWLRRTSLSLLAVGTFSVSLVASAVLHLELPVARRAAASVTQLALGSLPAKANQITIGSIERTSSELVVRDIEGSFTDEEGRPALTVRGVSTRVSYVNLVREWLDTGAVRLVCEDVRVRSADVSLDDDGGVWPRVARAFAKPNVAPAEVGSGSSSGPVFTMILDGIVVEHAWVHGVLGGAHFDADVDQIQASLLLQNGIRIRIDDADITERGLPRPTRGRVRGLVVAPPEGPVELAGDVHGTFGPATAHVQARGTVDRLDAVILAEEGGGTSDVVASFWLPKGSLPLGLVAYARTRRLPLTVFAPSAPEGTVSVNALVSLTYDGEIGGTAWVSSSPTTLGGTPVPAVVAKASGRARTWRIDARAEDDGGQVLAGADIDDAHVRGDAFVTLRDLSHIGPLPPTPVRGRAQAHVSADGNLATKSVDAAISAVAWGVSVGPGRADVVDLSGKVKWRDQSGVADGSVVARRGAARIEVDGRAIRFGKDGVASGAATLRAGQGRIEARAQSSQSGTSAAATVVALRASDLQPFVATAFPVKEALLDGALDVGKVGGVLQGSVHARVEDLTVTLADQEFEKGVVTLDAKLDDHDASFAASVLLDGEAALHVSSDRVHVPVLALDRASLLAITGRTNVDANATFACLRTWFGDRVPSKVGQAQVRIVYEHEQGGPHLASFEVETTGAELATPAGQVGGIDARAGGVVSLDDAHADVGASLHDAYGDLVLVRVGAAFGAPVWDAAAMADVERWKRTPLTVHVELPERDITTLPSLVRPLDLEGRIAAAVDLTGSILAPNATFSIDERGGRAKNRPGDPLVDLHVDGTYDQKFLAATIATRGAPATSLGGEVKLFLPWTDVLAGRADKTWEASGVLRAERLALGSIAGWFTRTQITGTVSGMVKVTGVHRDAEGAADLVLDQVAVGKRQVGSGRVIALLSGGRAAANVDLVQKMGRLDVAVGGKAQWGASLAPSLDFVDGIDGYVRAKSFDVSFVRPFVRQVLPGFNAVIDAAVALHLTSDLKTSHAVGMVMLSGGRAEVATLGDELKDVRIRVDLAKDGNAKISQVEIYPASGRINADGDAVFEGLSFRSALVHLRIPRGNEIPIGLEGMPVGELEGNVDVTFKVDAKGLGIGVVIPSTHLLLAPALGRTVQTLDPDAHIHVGRRVGSDFVDGAPTSAVVEGTSLPVHIDVTLGDDVWVKRQGDLEARVTGKVAVDLGKQLRLGGAVTVSEGWVEIQGRRFLVERARVSFDGQPPSDPIVQATARYDAPGGVKIFADYVGPVSTGHMFLRSEPSMPANEIVATLVFGSPTAQIGASSGTGSTTLQAAAVGGGYVSQGLNRALDDISPLDVSTRVDTTTSANPRPELTVRVTKDVGVTLGVNLGTPSPGQPPDRTILRIEYQFLPQWRVRSTSGDKGSSILDFIWQYRY